MREQRKHFHTFDALRFFAFLKVFLLHLPIIAFPSFNFLKNGGGTGVIFFFVLSGFLITYILLVEKKQTNSIDLKRFFLRRILRIWPLYYLMIAFAFLTPYLLSLLNASYSDECYQPNWLMSVLFLENYQMIITGDHPNVSPLGVTWSLCIEEHFYIIWGLLLYFINIKKLPVVFISCILVAMISRYFFIQNGLSTIDILTNIDYFMYGAIPAYFLVLYKTGLEKRLSAIPVYAKLLLITFVIGYVIVSPNIAYTFQSHIEPVILGLSFSFMICMILPEKNAVKIGDRNIFSKLGLYTYGLYLYHTIIINLLVQLSNKYEVVLNKPLNAIIFSVLALGFTAFVSILSYHLFEKYFLKLKNRFGKDKPIAAETTTAFAGSEVK